VLLAGQCTHPGLAGRCARSSRMPTGPSGPLRGAGDVNVTSPSFVAVAELFDTYTVLNPRTSVDTRSNPSPVRVLSSHSGDREISSSPGPSPSQCRYSPTGRGTPVNLKRQGFDTKDLTRQMEEDEKAWVVKEAVTDVPALQREVEHLKSKVVAGQEVRTELRADVQALQKEVEHLKSKLVAGQEVRADMKVELEASKLRENAAHRHLEMLEEEINELREGLQAIKEDASRQQQEYQQLLQWCSTCETERDQAVHRLEEVLQTLKSEQQGSLNRQLSLDAANKTSQELRTQITNLQQELLVCHQQVPGLIDEAQRKLSEARVTEHDLRDEVRTLRCQLQEMQRNFSEVDTERMALERQVEQERRQMTLKEKAHVSIQQELEQSKAKVKSLTDAAQSNANRMLEASAGAKESLDMLSGELEKCRTQLKDAQQRAMLAEEKVRLLQHEKEKVRVVDSKGINGTTELPPGEDIFPRESDEVSFKKKQTRAVRSAAPPATGSRSAPTCDDTADMMDVGRPNISVNNKVRFGKHLHTAHMCTCACACAFACSGVWDATLQKQAAFWLLSLP
jgi:FtsZ-binding cell division protein ZapB